MSNRFDGWTLRQEYIMCGKKRCKGCPHGPYWYGYRHWGNRTQKKYFGKKRPDWEPFRNPQTESETPHADDSILGKRTASLSVAVRVLALGEFDFDRNTLYKAYRKAIMRTHPDRGGDVRECQRVNAAFEYLREMCR